ncbi:UNKNOWN [Stylonychia lemnae]|uniref:Uncharacterized protein n=1 Tax=Stylonychia lemnae TaxID=5949 RepID=A0A077ZUM9_STYLE|nr:UNKNOWN [Stylonychia lemnae]|eukprot:CDW73597.1 UNKNOWN [Stylonychia lemnae]
MKQPNQQFAVNGQPIQGTGKALISKSGMRVRPITAVKKPFSKTTSIQTNFEDLYESNAFQVSKQRIIERPQSSSNLQLKQLCYNRNQLPEVLEEHNLHQSISARQKVVIYSSRSNSVNISQSKVDRTEEDIAHMRSNQNHSNFPLKKFSLKVELASNTRTTEGHPSTERKLSILDNIYPNNNNSEDQFEYNGSNNQDTNRQSNLFRIQNAKDSYHPLIYDEGIAGPYGSSLYNSGKQIQGSRYSIPVKRKNLVSHQDLLQQNENELIYKTQDQNMRKVLLSNNSQINHRRANQLNKFQQHHHSQAKLRPQSAYMNQPNLKNTPSQQQIVVQKPLGFKTYVQTVGVNFAETPQQQEFYNNLLQQSRNSQTGLNLNLVRNSSKNQQKTSEQDQSLKSLLQNPAVINSQYSKSLVESNLNGDRQLIKNQTQDNSNYQLLSQKGLIDKEKFQQQKQQFQLMIEQNKANITPSEKLSLMIQSNSNSKKHLNSQKQLLFIKRKLNTTKNQTNQDEVLHKMMSLLNFAKTQENSDNQDNQITDGLYELIDLYQNQSQTRHWREYQKFYRYEHVPGINGITDYWRNQIQKQEPPPQNLASYAFENHKHLYQDIGEIVLKSQGILNSDLVDEKTKKDLLQVFQSIIDNEKNKQIQRDVEIKDNKIMNVQIKKN